MSLSSVSRRVMISMMSRFVPLKRSVIDEGSGAGSSAEVDGVVNPRLGINLFNRLSVS